MSVKQKMYNSNGIFFITFTCFKWLSLFEITKTHNSVYKWFDYLKKSGHHITGYVIMPNHLHALISFENPVTTLDRTIGNGKRFLAYAIIRELKRQNYNKVLEHLSKAVHTSDRKRGKLHEVFENSFDIKECYNEKLICQKLDYIHSNPCVGKSKLAASPEEYQHSSAKYYFTGQHGIYKVTHIMDLLL